MFVGEYIDNKDNNGVRAITKREAKFFREKWPLRKGWFDRIKDILIDSLMMAALVQTLEDGKRKSGKKAIKALESTMSPGVAMEKT